MRCKNAENRWNIPCNNAIISLPRTDFDVFVKKMFPHSFLAVARQAAVVLVRHRHLIERVDTHGYDFFLGVLHRFAVNKAYSEPLVII